VEGLCLRTLVTVAYNFAWRKGELLNLRVRQVDLASRTIRLDVGTTKNGEAREVNMTDEVLTLLTACVTGKQGDDFVFTRSNGKPVKSFRKVWSTVCEKAGVPELLFHDLRRSGVRNLVRLGVKETVAMEISGHKTPSVFDRHNITSKKGLADVAELLNTKQKSIAALLDQGAISLGQRSGSLARKVVQNAEMALPLAPPPTTLSN
jgi:integrase